MNTLHQDSRSMIGKNLVHLSLRMRTFFKFFSKLTRWHNSMRQMRHAVGIVCRLRRMRVGVMRLVRGSQSQMVRVMRVQLMREMRVSTQTGARVAQVVVVQQVQVGMKTFLQV